MNLYLVAEVCLELIDGRGVLERMSRTDVVGFALVLALVSLLVVYWSCVSGRRYGAMTLYFGCESARRRRITGALLWIYALLSMASPILIVVWHRLIAAGCLTRRFRRKHNQCDLRAARDKYPQASPVTVPIYVTSKFVKPMARHSLKQWCMEGGGDFPVLPVKLVTMKPPRYFFYRNYRAESPANGPLAWVVPLAMTAVLCSLSRILGRSSSAQWFVIECPPLLTQR